uniref:Uncharacterized protein n=1 Tax=viral metagenome TaxID=1070528 RepID=A0A6H1ZK24_9ZZZZ
MGFLSGPGMAGAAGGANQALQNFLNFYMQNKELKQRKDIEKERFDEQVRLRKATEAHQTGMMGISQSRENRELRAAEDAATQQLREQMAVQPMPQYPAVPQGMAGGPEAYPEMPGPMSFEDQLRGFTQVSPGAGLKMQGELQKREQPRTFKVIYGPNNQTKMVGVTGDTELPEGWSFDKPAKDKNLTFRTETKAVGNLTFSREVGRDTETGEIKYRGDWGSEPSKRERPEKPEYTSKQALSRISTIDSAISRMKASGTIDTAIAIQNPELAGLLNTQDPEAVKQAIASLENEREYVSQFAPEKDVPKAKPIIAKQLDQTTAAAILQEAGGDKAKAREIAKKRGYSF